MSILDDEETESHPSYGMIGFSRISIGGGVARKYNLFGSHVNSHHTAIEMTLYRAVRKHGYATDRYRSAARVPIAQVVMSATQFAELLTGMNVGDGVPCTIQNIEGVGMPECPPQMVEHERIENGFAAKTKGAYDAIKASVDKARSILATGALKVAERKDLTDALNKIVQEVGLNFPYVVEVFSESVDKTVQSARAEVDAFVTHVTVKTGIAELRRLSGQTSEPEVRQIAGEK